MILEKLSILEYFDMIVCSDDVSHPKPDPESLNLILTKLGADSRYSVMIGDANNDVICAKAASITSIGVTWGDVRKEKLLMSEPDYVADTVDELRNFIAKAMNESRRRNWVFENDMVCAESKCNLTNIYLVTGYTDMRKSIDGLCAIIMKNFKHEPDGHSIYLFCGKRCDRIKVLFKEPDGYILLYKRLDVLSGRYRWPRNSSEVKPITWQQFDWLMSGLEIEQPKALRMA